LSLPLLGSGDVLGYVHEAMGRGTRNDLAARQARDRRKHAPGRQPEFLAQHPGVLRIWRSPTVNFPVPGQDTAGLQGKSGKKSGSNELERF
jgi:hypothetical protein